MLVENHSKNTSTELKYSWIENWNKQGFKQGWSHHGLVVTNNDIIITSCSSKREALFYNTEGDLLSSFPLDVIDAHGLNLSVENGETFLWVTDAGKRREAGGDYNYPKFHNGKVIKYTLEGKKMLEINKNHIPQYKEKRIFSPTVSAINPRNDDIWVTDGYGSNTVYCFDKDANYLRQIDGSTGAGTFNCPHWVFIDQRKSEAELLVADRVSDRIQVFDLEGNFLRCFAQDITRKPSVFSTWGEYLIVGELEARLLIFDKKDNLIAEIGDGYEYVKEKGWPNRLNQNNKPTRPKDLVPGKFNSPHGLSCDSEGNIYICEWLIGGRFTKLARHIKN